MLTMEKTNAEMSTMRDNQFFGDIAQEENNKKECAMMGLIKNQIIVLNEELDVAYNRLGQVATDEENWSGKYERKMACKILRGQIAILTKLEKDMEKLARLYYLGYEAARRQLNALRAYLA